MRCGRGETSRRFIPGAGVERGQCRGGGLGCRGSVDLLERRCDRFAIFPAREVQRIPDQMHDAGLDHRFRKHRMYPDFYAWGGLRIW